jgi:hypothetical protein
MSLKKLTTNHQSKIMKIKTLQKLLDTNYILQHERCTGNLLIGSECVQELLTVNRATLKVYTTYKFKLIQHYIAKQLRELARSGQLRELLENNDVIDNPITIYIYNRADQVVEKTCCENFGYPNTDINGYLQYNNTTFLTEKEALESAIKDMNTIIRNNTHAIAKLKKELSEHKNMKKNCEIKLKQFQKKLLKP